MTRRPAGAAGIAVALLFVAAPVSADCNAEVGRKLFRPCLACHTMAPGAGHLSGPNLFGLMGRTLGGAEGYVYSEPFASSELAWDEQMLADYLADPQAFLPGTRMMFSGISKREDSDAIACYLRSLVAR